MSYEVIITPEAQRNIWAAFLFIRERSPQNAERWLSGLYKAVHSLEDFPGRCGEAREARVCRRPLKQLIYKSYRLIYQIESGQAVRILSVRHAKRRPLRKNELPGE